jgi:hypothetical protein
MPEQGRAGSAQAGRAVAGFLFRGRAAQNGYKFTILNFSWKTVFQ